MESGAVTGINTTLAVVFTWVGYKTARIIWKYTPYSYPNARINAMEAKLLNEQRFNELAESRTLENFTVALEDTDYREYFASVPDYSIESIERAFEESLAGLYRMMAKMLPGRSRDFFNLLLEGWDVRNIASVVKAKLAGEPADDYVIGVGTMLPKIRAMAESKSMEEILVILEGTPYEEPYQRLLLGETTPAEFETELYRIYYGKLLNYALSRGGDERAVLEEFVRLNIDRLNIITALRGKAAGMSAEEIRSMLIEGGSVNLEPILHVDDLGMALAEMDSTRYGPVLRDVRERVESDLGVLEAAFNRYIITRMSEMVRFYPLSVATPISYVLKRESEIRRLKAVAKLIDDGVSPERIKETVGELA